MSLRDVVNLLESRGFEKRGIAGLGFWGVHLSKDGVDILVFPRERELRILHERDVVACRVRRVGRREGKLEIECKEGLKIVIGERIVIRNSRTVEIPI